MNTTTFERNLIQKIEKEIPGVTPGLQVQVHQLGKKVCDISIGQTFPYYDFASLTKIVFTTPLFMKAFEDKKWTLETKVSDLCPWFKHSEIRVTQCLNHSSGLAWWLPFFELVDYKKTDRERWLSTQQMINDSPLDLKDISVYSDVGFVMLGHFLEAMFEEDLFSIWNSLKEEVYPRSTLNFHPHNQAPFEGRLYAPTERSEWRHKLIQGEVHDDNTWSFGGVSTHAGIFGSIDDLGWYALFLRSILQGYAKTYVRQKTALLFSSKTRPQGQGDWAYGFMMPSSGQSSSGDYFSPASVGHTGFTGTSLWYDPVHDISVAILSNRVFLGRDNKQFAQLRPKIHNWVVQGLRKV
jgi:CubicO group peptidase (beta-lactamase class C family)